MIKDDVISSKANNPLFNSFTFVKGIGVKAESTLRELGIRCWNDVVIKKRPDLFPERKWYTLLDGVNSAINALKTFNIALKTVKKRVKDHALKRYLQARRRLCKVSQTSKHE